MLRAFAVVPVAGLSAALACASAVAERPEPGCVRECEGYLHANVKAVPLSADRIVREAGPLRAAYARYLAASVRARDADRAVLRAERAQLTAPPPARPSDARGIDSMPLDRPIDAYATTQALAIAREIADFQIPSGGWGKNLRRTGEPRRLGQSWIADALDPDGEQAHWHFVGTIDNNATTTELRYLAKVQRAQTGDRALLRASLRRGIDYLLTAQYPDGGWPQVYPLAGGYADAVTLNDDAMLEAVRLLHDIGRDHDGDFAFVDGARRRRAAEAAQRGIAWLLAHQVVVDGRRTLWAQQYDPLTGAPTAARAFEMPALASSESVRILEFLMQLPDPDAATRNAIRDGMAFLRATRIDGRRWTQGRLESRPDGAVWARFYAFDRYAPDAADVHARAQALFGDRPSPHDSAAYGLVFDTVTSVSEERRRGYAQYNDLGTAALARFAHWQRRFPE